MRHVWVALARAGLCPEGPVVADECVDLQPGEDLLPLMILAWKKALETGFDPTVKSAANVLGVLQRFERAGASMTRGIPGPSSDGLGRWLGDRLAWWPRGVPSGRRVGLVSSRLGRNLDGQRHWFHALRMACMKLDPERDLIVTSESVASHRFVQRSGKLFSVPALNVLVDRRDEPSMRQWAKRVLATDTATNSTGTSHRAELSPPISEASGSEVCRELAGLPLPDRVIVAISDQLVALHVRPEGNLDRLLATRLEGQGFPPASVFLAIGPDLVPRATAEQLMDLGAVGWYALDRSGQRAENESLPWNQPGESGRGSAPVIRCPADKDWPYLTHCTRRQSGPWPDEDEDAYLDNLILDRSGADHSAFASLWRIVRSGRLLATSGLIRGGTSVVSLTAVPLGQLHRLRTFRSHLSRWDFESYGICIRRDWLAERGARPVQYGEQALWEQLTEEDRPFFQKKQSRSEKGTVVDWTVEEEWRHLGDLDLQDVPADAAILFVPTQGEAEQLVAISRWPVAAVGRVREC